MLTAVSCHPVLCCLQATFTRDPRNVLTLIVSSSLEINSIIYDLNIKSSDEQLGQDRMKQNPFCAINTYFYSILRFKSSFVALHNTKLTGYELQKTLYSGLEVIGLIIL